VVTMDDTARPPLEQGEAEPGWQIKRPADASGSLTEGLRALGSRSAVSWYTGAGISLIWLISPGAAVVQVSHSAISAAAGLTLLVLFGLAFLASAPLQWSLTTLGRLLVSGALLALSLTLSPWLGWQTPAIWTYVGVSVGMAALAWRYTWPIIMGIGVVAAVCELIDRGGWDVNALWVPAIIVSISMMMAAFAQTQATMNRLRASQRQVEALAAERERGRVARDIHDILGHSLTVITVKSELAGRLVDVDPNRAKTEIGDIETLARGALADVRATVAGFRGVNISGELAAARAALTAAGIAPDFPSSTDAVPPAHRELAGWVVREGVTNVVRHSSATTCRIRLGAHEIAVEDDGVGPNPSSTASTGLSGLRERVECVGGRMSVGRSDLGGFRLRVVL